MRLRTKEYLCWAVAVLVFALIIYLINLNDASSDSRSFPSKIRLYGYNGTNWQPVTTDSSSRAFAIVGYQHHELHEGNHRLARDGVTLNSTARAYVLSVTTTTTLPHLLHSLDTQAAADIGYYSGVTASSDGTSLTVINNRFDKGTSSNLTIQYNPTVSSNGTHLYTLTLGSGKKVGGDVGREEEFVLASGSQYMIYVLDTSASNNDITIDFNWYEHADETP